MERKEYLTEPIKHIKIDGSLTVDQLIQQYKNSGSLGAGRLAVACDIYKKMLKEKNCTIFLALSGAVVPAGMRSLITDLIRNHMIDVIVSTGACMVHDAIGAVGGRHYKGSWVIDDAELFQYHLFRI
jgi:deoxyhypusine synthase